MNCTVYTSKDIAQCAGSVNVGTLTTGTDWTLRVVNVASGREAYVIGTGPIVIDSFDFSPGSVYAMGLTDGTFKPFAAEGTPGTIEVDMVYVKVVKAFAEDGTLYTPTEQWIVLAQ